MITYTCLPVLYHAGVAELVDDVQDVQVPRGQDVRERPRQTLVYYTQNFFVPGWRNW
ncbi:MAG: hypothetical protein HY356_03005 [Gammaproteobacteria bacterium]|nr:hypothetical protein [Gammaproteobacteria bacterium]